MDLADIAKRVDALQTDPVLWVETQMYERNRALDLLDMLLEGVARFDEPDALELNECIQALQQRLHTYDERIFRRVRKEIRSGHYRGTRLRHELLRYTNYGSADGSAREAHFGFDGLDILVEGVFFIEPPPRSTRSLGVEMIACQYTPARVILALLDRVSLQESDCFVDIGSGLGQVVLLVHLLTGVSARGIEYEPVYCDYARVCGERFAVRGVEWVNADARQADYERGTVFFMFTPFTGRLLQQVLRRLQDRAVVRPITICTYGPCTPVVAQTPWLRLVGDDAHHEFKLTVFKSLDDVVV